jgi:hypothetical protein
MILFFNHSVGRSDEVKKSYRHYFLQHYEYPIYQVRCFRPFHSHHSQWLFIVIQSQVNHVVNQSLTSYFPLPHYSSSFPSYCLSSDYSERPHHPSSWGTLWGTYACHSPNLQGCWGPPAGWVWSKTRSRTHSASLGLSGRSYPTGTLSAGCGRSGVTGRLGSKLRPRSRTLN